jgi:translocation and assembly module TamB
MESGQAEFTISDPYDPELDARGKSRTLGYDIDMTVGGTLSSPNLEFESDPSMTNDEVLLLLTGGVLPGNDTTSTLSQNSGKLAFYLGQGFVTDLFGSSSSDRLRIASGEDISESGRETFNVEYDLTDDLSVIGEYDKYDRYNLDVRWRIRSK